MVNKILGALLPAYCSLCRMPSECELPLCSSCRALLIPNDLHCIQCALPLATPQAPLCGQCLQQPPPFARVIAPWVYCEVLAFFIQRWKYHNELSLTPLLASLWLSAQPLPTNVDIVVPVPLHWRRLLSRGYNQSHLFAQQLCKKQRQLKLAPGMVGRIRHTAPQSSLGVAARSSNLAAAFTVRQPCRDARIAIVDDVMTTGQTAAALARCLRAAGARSVEVWCIARTPAPTP